MTDQSQSPQPDDDKLEQDLKELTPELRRAHAIASRIAEVIAEEMEKPGADSAAIPIVGILAVLKYALEEDEDMPPQLGPLRDMARDIHDTLIRMLWKLHRERQRVN